MATTFDSTKTELSKLLEDVVAGKIQLPDFQRGWVWTTNTSAPCWRILVDWRERLPKQASPLDVIEGVFGLAEQVGGMEQLRKLVDRLASR